MVEILPDLFLFFTRFIKYIRAHQRPTKQTLGSYIPSATAASFLIAIARAAGHARGSALPYRRPCSPPSWPRAVARPRLAALAPAPSPGLACPRSPPHHCLAPLAPTPSPDLAWPCLPPRRRRRRRCCAAPHGRHLPDLARPSSPQRQCKRPALHRRNFIRVISV